SGTVESCPRPYSGYRLDADGLSAPCLPMGILSWSDGGGQGEIAPFLKCNQGAVRLRLYQHV
ncbi:MAG: hypothetical protein V3V70_06915, partial [Candidatus Scalindua sp.]